jgi:hypothetical protein
MINYLLRMSYVQLFRNSISLAVTSTGVVYGVTGTDVPSLPEYGVSPSREAAISRSFEMRTQKTKEAK